MYLNQIPQVMVTCLSLTILIETLSAVFIGIKNKKDLLNVVLVNILTNPLVVSLTIYFEVYYGLKARKIIEAILEISVIFVEGFIYKKTLKYNKINPFLLAFSLNFSSYMLGIVINNFIY